MEPVVEHWVDAVPLLAVLCFADQVIVGVLGAVHEQVVEVFGHCRKVHGLRDIECSTELAEHAWIDHRARAVLLPRLDRVVEDRDIFVWDNKLFTKLKDNPEPVAVWAGAEGRVKGEQAGGEFAQ